MDRWIVGRRELAGGVVALRRLGWGQLAVRCHPVPSVLVITAAMAAVTAAFVHRLADLPAIRSTGAWAFVLVLAAFALAEVVVFHVEYRRETVSFSVSEVPLAFALVFLSPPLAVAARCTGAVIAMAAIRTHPLKAVFNVALFGLEAALAAAALRILGGWSVDDPARLMVALALALLSTSVAGCLLVSLVVSLFEGGLLKRLRGELRTGSAVYVLGPVIGVVAVSVALLDGALTPVPVLLIAAFWAMLRSHGRLAQRHRDLAALHGFTAAVGRTLQLEDIAGAAVTEIGQLLRAEHCALVVTEPGSDRLGPEVGPDVLLWAARALLADGGDAEAHGSSEPVVLAGEQLDRLGPTLAAEGISEVVATRVGDAEGQLALLLVANREGVHPRFDADDLARLASLTGQLAAALRNGSLHGRIEHEVTHDGLTGLANRTLFADLVTQALEDPHGGGTVGVLMIDLDRFKEVNDTLGHHVGDRLLEGFSARVRSLIGVEDVLARFAGDEFALLARREDPEQLERLASAIVLGLRQPFELDDIGVVVTGSIGIARAPDHGLDVTTLLRRADIAMYEAKACHSGWEVYRPEADRSIGDRLALHGELRTALEQRRIGLHFQPKVHLATRTVVGVEALARWEHPTRGLVPPDEFVALAEQTGLIHQLTDQVLCEALAAARHWHLDGADLSVAVNLSTHNLLDELLPDRVARLLEQHQVQPGQLTLEITESSVMSDAARTLVTLDRLHRLGVRLSVDDFGTGYSSLNYLRRLPVSEVKVDRSFVADLLLEDQDEVIVRSTIDLGHNLGLQVVAEGVENDPILARLDDLGCDLAQGYGISRPLPLAKFDAWLRTAPYAVRRTSRLGGQLPA